MKIAFTGAPGKDKSALALWVSCIYGLPMESWDKPNGNLASTPAKVSHELTGIYDPYMVDALGLRTTFQYKLLERKREWELAHPDGFVTDMTYYDILTWSILHDADGSMCDPDFLMRIAEANQYDLILHVPPPEFVPDRMYDALLLSTCYGESSVFASVCGEIADVGGGCLKHKKDRTRKTIENIRHLMGIRSTEFVLNANAERQKGLDRLREYLCPQT